MRLIVYVEGPSDKPRTSSATAGSGPLRIRTIKKPPKRVIEGLFAQYLKRKYIDTSDARWILKHGRLEEIEAECTQRFAPFVRELREIVAGRAPA